MKVVLDRGRPGMTMPSNLFRRLRWEGAPFHSRISIYLIKKSVYPHITLKTMQNHKPANEHNVPCEVKSFEGSKVVCDAKFAEGTLVRQLSSPLSVAPSGNPKLSPARMCASLSSLSSAESVWRDESGPEPGAVKGAAKGAVQGAVRCLGTFVAAARWLVPHTVSSTF